ncbi:nicotinamide-nucleotide adenylyltransferase [Stygiolobus caldivivus]|uniref:Nicotinamide-nucleotide adenylyltransferase n=1 Tax=Stygiolobus caldivivus TaxID=2824673 RepID=A0A8D5U7U0_9CREN|nr:nicotinamide-nucleotide adenylyltransferase [Stygiolobus caldivivus]
MERVDELIIVIGSAQESHTLSNPFTAGERIEMIRRTLEGNNIDLSTIYFIPIPDILMNSVWVYHVKSFSPNFDLIISRNPLVLRLFKEAKYEILEPPPYDRKIYNSTYIRRLMIENNNEWEKLVPTEVSNYIHEIKGDERLRSIAGLS